MTDAPHPASRTRTTPEPPPTIEIRAPGLDFAGQPLFENLSLTLPAGEWTCLLGPSGVGKTTLLRLVAGLAEPWEGTKVTDAAGRDVAGRVAYMAQQDLLLPWLSARDNVSLGARLRGRPADRGRADRLLAQVGLADEALRRPAALSGGQRQRVALARTLIEDAPVVLMDEPFAAVDAITRHDLQAAARDLLAGRTVLFVTHDPFEALRVGDTIHVMAGRPARMGEPIRPPGPAPRDIHDPEIVRLHRAIMERLVQAKAAA
jgi:putative hydroxymethylpyrimidine transport system ATP-binding protein